MISDDRIAQNIAYLEALSNKSKNPSDTRGLYLGDGIPRPYLGNAEAQSLRSNELKDMLEELQNLRRLIRKVARKEAGE